MIAPWEDPAGCFGHCDPEGLVRAVPRIGRFWEGPVMRIPRWMRAPEVRRWLTLRCAHCGHRFRWTKDARFSFGNRDVYHNACMGYLVWRRKADERLAILGVTAELAQVSGRDVRLVMELRAAAESDRAAASDVAWRVFRDLESHDSEKSN